MFYPCPQLRLYFHDGNGHPLVGGKLKTFVSNSTIPIRTVQTYKNAEGTVLNPTEITLDERGECTVFLTAGVIYRFELYDSDGALVLEQDGISVASGGGSGGSAPTIAVESGSNGIDVQQTIMDSGVVLYTVSAKKIEDAIEAEKNRAESAESALSKSIADETKRATEAEKGLADAIEAEKKRAEEAERTLSESISQETERAIEAEKASRTEIVAGDNITVDKTTGEDGHDIYTINGEKGAYTNIDAATANPLMDGTAAVGVSVKYAREDHVHPSDTSREDKANKTTVVLGTSDSKYPTDKAVAEFVNSSIDKKYSSTSTKAQSGVAVNEAFKTRETSSSDDSYTYLGMNLKGPSTEKLYWKLVSFKPVFEYWTLQFEIDVCNGRKGEKSFDTCIYETKRLTVYSYDKDTVKNAIELRYTSQSNSESRGYGNNIYYEMDSSGTVTIFIYTNRTANTAQICRLTSLRNFKNISNITWYEPVVDAGTQPTNPIKFKEEFPAIASKTSAIGSDSVPVYVNKGKPVACNSSNLKAGKDDDGNVIKNTYATKTELNAKGLTVKKISGEQVICFE